MSTPDLLTDATRFFILAEHASRLEWRPHMMFLETFASSAGETVACLPALAPAVRKEHNDNVLRALALHPLPGVLLPEAVPWFGNLVEAWEVHHASSVVWHQNLARRALVRLDGCSPPDGMQRPSRLPEWLEEGRRMANGVWRGVMTMYPYLEALAALAAWRPAPRVLTPPETLREWVAFWLERRRSRSPLIKGIAAMALLNLPEANLRAASIPLYGRVPNPPVLLRDLAAAIPAAAERTARVWYHRHLLMLDWQPGENNPLPAAGVAEVARNWLEIASHNHWRCRQMALRQLIRWDRTGSLAPCGIDLLPRLVRATQTEDVGDVLWEMSRWMPAAEFFTGTEKPDRLDLLRQLETAWQRHRQSGGWLGRASAWLSGIRLHQAGLASEPPDSFREAYLSAVAQEGDRDVLLVLAQWSPGAEAPAAWHRKWRQGWQSRLGEKDEWIRQVAVFALLRKAVENGTDQSMRHAALEVWRTGTKEGQATGQILNAGLSRLHEVRAELAAGRAPDFEAEPTLPAERHYPRLALPPGHITGREWKMENGKLRMENHEGALAPGNRPAPNGPSR